LQQLVPLQLYLTKRTAGKIAHRICLPEMQGSILSGKYHQPEAEPGEDLNKL